ncbi:Sip1-related alpha-galactosidase [Draconibacterium sediminis]|uniref:Glycoside hydrolase family 36 n=1 Tax=Draconibacterium sediminis TaxID=1544798 RepID=A0A0D8JF50_9BACT|nr:Sip1-related alpha-galactosidase [Draconibacterium sediminis]KJF45334.1 hypothetical protein LH29_08130 [Draconibacterium sediminis]
MKKLFLKQAFILFVAINLILSLLGCSNLAKEKETKILTDKGSVIHADLAEGTGVVVLEDFAAAPINGNLKTLSTILPQYESLVYFSTDGRERMLDAANRIFPWAANNLKTIVSDGFKPDPKADVPSRNGLLALFKLKDGNYLVLQGIASPMAYAHLRINDNGDLSVILTNFGVDPVAGDIPILAWAKDKDIYKAFQGAWQSAINTAALKERTAMRYEKEYPEIFKYLGWCSWEQYRRKISSDLMVDAMNKIEKNPLPIRWVMVDDGHQHQTGFTMGDSRMLSFGAHPESFPSGFKPLMDLKSDKIKWMGIWHAMNGQWQGLNPEHEMKELAPYMIRVSKKYKGEPMDVMMPKGDSVSSWMFYKGLVGSSKDHGFDFVKIDNQNRQMAFYKGLGNPVKTVSQHAQSLERAAHELSGGLINCFCADLLSLMNTKYSAVSRVSVDYLLNNEEKAKSHLFQSYQNTLWMGQAIWPDHDMFHSSDKFAGRMMAVSKAMSGAPIYLSDAPDDFLNEMVTPLCYSDGRLLRPLAPAVPLPESATISALSEPKAYRVVAPLPHGAAAFVVYNLAHPTPAESIKTQISAEDYTYAGSFIQPAVDQWKVPEEGLVYYDWYEGKGGILNEKYEIELNGFSDRFVQLTPIVNGWSVIGSTDKYLSAAAVETIDYSENEVKLKLIESGSIIVFNRNKINCAAAQKIEDLGNNLWKIMLQSGTKEVEISIIAIDNQ